MDSSLLCRLLFRVLLLVLAGVNIPESLVAQQVVCPFNWAGCAAVCPRRDLELHLESCSFANAVAQREREAMASAMRAHCIGNSSHSPLTSASREGSNDVGCNGNDGVDNGGNHWDNYEVVCPNAVMGCRHVCGRSQLSRHLGSCAFGGGGSGRDSEDAERVKARRVRTRAKKKTFLKSGRFFCIAHTLSVFSFLLR